MSQSLVKNLIHLVFSTKRRQLWLPADVREVLFAYLAGIFGQWESPALVWQNGYAAFSVSESNVRNVRRYIENQREHHRTMVFQDERRALLGRHGVEFDERYVWD